MRPKIWWSWPGGSSSSAWEQMITFDTSQPCSCGSIDGSKIMGNGHCFQPVTSRLGPWSQPLSKLELSPLSKKLRWHRGDADPGGFDNSPVPSVGWLKESPGLTDHPECTVDYEASATGGHLVHAPCHIGECSIDSIKKYIGGDWCITRRYIFIAISRRHALTRSSIETWRLWVYYGKDDAGVSEFD